MELFVMTRDHDDTGAAEGYPTTSVRCPSCGTRIDEIELGSEPDDPDYGADTDGNRGRFLAGSTWIQHAPDDCTACGAPLDFDVDRKGNVTAYLREEGV